MDTGPQVLRRRLTFSQMGHDGGELGKLGPVVRLWRVRGSPMGIEAGDADEWKNKKANRVKIVRDRDIIIIRAFRMLLAPRRRREIVSEVRLLIPGWEALGDHRRSCMLADGTIGVCR